MERGARQIKTDLQRRKDGTGNYKRLESKEQYADSNQCSADYLADLKVRR